MFKMKMLITISIIAMIIIKKGNEGCMYIQMIMNDEVYKVIVDEMFIEHFLMNIESKSYPEK